MSDELDMTYTIPETITGKLERPHSIESPIASSEKITGKLQKVETLESVLTIPHVVSESDYVNITNKPCINEHELNSGENSLVELGIGLTTNTAINRLF